MEYGAVDREECVYMAKLAEQVRKHGKETLRLVLKPQRPKTRVTRSHACPKQ